MTYQLLDSPAPVSFHIRTPSQHCVVADDRLWWRCSTKGEAVWPSFSPTSGIQSRPRTPPEGSPSGTSSPVVRRSRVSSATTTTSAPSRNSSVTTCTPRQPWQGRGAPTGCSERRHAPMGLRRVGRPAVLPRAPAPCSTVREEEATDSQPRVTAGAVGRRRPSGPGVLDCAARSVARATQLWRIGS